MQLLTKLYIAFTQPPYVAIYIVMRIIQPQFLFVYFLHEYNKHRVLN